MEINKNLVKELTDEQYNRLGSLEEEIKKAEKNFKDEVENVKGEMDLPIGLVFLYERKSVIDHYENGHYSWERHPVYETKNTVRLARLTHWIINGKHAIPKFRSVSADGSDGNEIGNLGYFNYEWKENTDAYFELCECTVDEARKILAEVKKEEKKKKK